MKCSALTLTVIASLSVMTLAKHVHAQSCSCQSVPNVVSGGRHTWSSPTHEAPVWRSPVPDTRFRQSNVVPFLISPPRPAGAPADARLVLDPFNGQWVAAEKQTRLEKADLLAFADELSDSISDNGRIHVSDASESESTDGSGSETQSGPASESRSSSTTSTAIAAPGNDPTTEEQRRNIGATGKSSEKSWSVLPKPGSGGTSAPSIGGSSAANAPAGMNAGLGGMANNGGQVGGNAPGWQPRGGNAGGADFGGGGFGGGIGGGGNNPVIAENGPEVPPQNIPQIPREDIQETQLPDTTEPQRPDVPQVPDGPPVPDARPVPEVPYEPEVPRAPEYSVPTSPDDVLPPTHPPVDDEDSQPDPQEGLIVVPRPEPEIPDATPEIPVSDAPVHCGGGLIPGVTSGDSPIVPEPGSLALLGIASGIAGGISLRRRRTNRNSQCSVTP